NQLAGKVDVAYTEPEQHPAEQVVAVCQHPAARAFSPVQSTPDNEPIVIGVFQKLRNQPEIEGQVGIGVKNQLANRRLKSGSDGCAESTIALVSEQANARLTLCEFCGHGSRAVLTAVVHQNEFQKGLIGKENFKQR